VISVKESSRVINEAAQDILSLDEVVDWFSSLDPSEQKDVLREIVLFSMQAHATAEDAKKGLLRSGVRPTVTPAVLITREPILEQMGKIINLPHNENIKSFRVLLSTFTVADERRRRTECLGKCSHAWHNLQGGLGHE
jgi:hypothetical protein